MKKALKYLAIFITVLVLLFVLYNYISSISAYRGALDRFDETQTFLAGSCLDLNPPKKCATEGEIREMIEGKYKPSFFGEIYDLVLPSDLDLIGCSKMILYELCTESEE